MIKFPSLKTLGDSLIETTLRYKEVALIALIKTIIFIMLVEMPHEESAVRNQLTQLSFIATLALPLILAIRLSGERHNWKPYVQPALIASTVLVLAVYYWLMDKTLNQSGAYRFFIFLAGAHLLVSYAPFIGTNDKDGFWQFNKTLFIQFLNATLYSATLYVGLLIAVETVKYLFGIESRFFIEIDLFLIVSCFFHTIFFLSKIPKPDEVHSDYPHGLKVFTQYVLLPLEVVYLVILYAYVGKIVTQWQLPQGRVAYLVLAFSVAGIFALLLLYPLRQNTEERWLKIFGRRYYLALLPLIVLLFTGIFRRIDDYGVTENRYIVAVLALWLSAITFYSLSGKRDDIRWIPISLSVLCLLLPIGPWNIFLVSRDSQLKQFEHILSKNQMLDASRHLAQKKTVTVEDRQQLMSIIRFFRDRELPGLEPYFAGVKQGEKRDGQHYSIMENTLDRYAIAMKTDNEARYMSFSSQTSRDISGATISGFDRMIFIDGIDNDTISDGKIEVVKQDSGKVLAIFRGNKQVVTWNVVEKVRALQAVYGNESVELPQDSLILSQANYKMVFRILSSSNDDDFYGSGVLFYKSNP
ncbi:hypothetical protein GCM10007423_60480 [Dyadobacter endophyticus]|uniref:DUF4153 domain-containing protein n=1 Tax=Dyadobacter endophyticus TaxID=1749036 RepID=A0ABQ1Z8Z8_9BACT|nr:DUF4153 domain-containing protein [Dyadobacter endophyticus]GGH54198.1 hypothetical protein GCM10007423_60480 [Dyadobacter endophyticus]